MRDVKQYLQSQQSSSPLSDKWSQFQELYDKRLWHELTTELLVFVKNDHFKQNGGLVDLYENFLADFEHRINQLALTELILIIAKEYKESEKAIELFNKTKEKVKSSTECSILCLTSIGNLMLQDKKLDDAKKIIREAQALLDTVTGVTSAHGRFYDLSSNYSKVVGLYNEYYRDALRFLGCMDLKQLAVDDLRLRAFNLGLAALLGNEVFNFGELLAHPVLETLKGTQNEWLIDLLFAFNAGNIDKFHQLESKWKTQADLAANSTQLLQKITLLSLIELTFKRVVNDRSLPFALISEVARLPIDEVEFLVMKALSVGLIRGSIDEVAKVAHITWIQPRVLDTTQLSTMQTLIGDWGKKVKTSAILVEDNSPELVVN